MMITPDRIRAFLDDLTILSMKHGISTTDTGIFAAPLDEIDDTFRGYAANLHSQGKRDQRWMLTLRGGDGFLDRRDDEQDIVSLDVSTITGHQCVALAKSLGSIRAPAPTGTDIPTRIEE